MAIILDVRGVLEPDPEVIRVDTDRGLLHNLEVNTDVVVVGAHRCAWAEEIAYSWELTPVSIETLDKLGSLTLVEKLEYLRLPLTCLGYHLADEGLRRVIPATPATISDFLGALEGRCPPGIRDSVGQFSLGPLSQALEGSIALLRSWPLGHQSNSHMKWVLPASLEVQDAELAGLLNECGLDTSCFDGAGSCLRVWLSCVSFQALRRGVSTKRFRILDRALRALVSELSWEGPWAPWQEGFPSARRCLPCTLLHAVHGDDLTRKLLDHCIESGLLTLGHLSYFDPRAINLVRSPQLDSWFCLYGKIVGLCH